MKREKTLIEKRRDFVIQYVRDSKGLQMKVIVAQLSERLFLTERTIYEIIRSGLVKYKKQN